MKTKNTLIYIGIMLALLLTGSVLAVLSFHTPLFAGIDVFFYRGLALIIFWGAVVSAILAVLRFCIKDIFLPRDVVMLFIVFCCVNVVFFTHVPVTADRSVTVFMLGHMADNEDQSFTEQEMEDYFVERYVQDYRAFQKRFHEQLETGTIEEVAPGVYRITESGKKLMQIYEKVGEAYLIDDKLIHPDQQGTD